MDAAQGGEDVDLDKLAADELSRLQRQFRIMELDKATMINNALPQIRVQHNMLRILENELNDISADLKVAKSDKNLEKDLRYCSKVSDLLANAERLKEALKSEKFRIDEIDYLISHCKKEINTLKREPVLQYSEENTGRLMKNMLQISVLEDRQQTVTKKFNTVNTENTKMRQQIDSLLKERAVFNQVWSKLVDELQSGKRQMIDLIDQATTAYDQRETWCTKLEALKERALGDVHVHTMEMRELQRQLDLNQKLHEFLRVKGTVRVMAALEAEEEAKRQAIREEEERTMTQYKEILENLKEFTNEKDVDQLAAQFTKRDEENYALFNYVNEVNYELVALSETVKGLYADVEQQRLLAQARAEQQEETLDTLNKTLDLEKEKTNEMKNTLNTTNSVLDSVLTEIGELFSSMHCDGAPILQLLGTNKAISIHNVMLYIRTMEQKILELKDSLYHEEHRTLPSPRTVTKKEKKKKGKHSVATSPKSPHVDKISVS